jgi:hypothetical protein
MYTKNSANQNHQANRSKSMLKKAIIFCQAPAEIANSLCQYEKCLNDRYAIYIICLHSKGIYNFLLTLNLKAEIYYFEDPYAKYNSLNYFRNKKLVKMNLLKFNIQATDKILVFFASRIDTYIGMYLKHFLKYTIYYVINFDAITINPDIDNTVTIIDKWKAKLTSLIIGFKCCVSYADGHLWSILDLNSYNIVEVPFILDKSIFIRYRYKNISFNQDKKVIFFTEPYRNKYQTKENYDTMNVSVVKKLQKKGYFVCMKGHPRIGSHPLLRGMVDLEIPDFLPSQFLDLNDFNFAIGFTSSALCDSPIDSYSVLEMCEITDAQYKERLKNLLEKMAPGKIQYIHSYDDIIYLKYEYMPPPPPPIT